MCVFSFLDDFFLADELLIMDVCMVCSSSVLVKLLMNLSNMMTWAR